MNNLDEFRRYYNHTIHPEMMRLDKQRIRLLRLLVCSLVLILATLLITAKAQILVLSLAVLLPICVYMGYLYRQVRKFQTTFKPHIIRLILDFIDNAPNFGTLYYSEGQSIEKGHFDNARLFSEDIIEYRGEDYITGIIGELAFQMCELEARAFSRVRSKIDTVFKGVFLHAQFHNREARGMMIAVPRAKKPYEIRTIKNFVLEGAKEVSAAEQLPEFHHTFLTYASKDAPIHSLLSPEMQNAILDYKDSTAHDISISFMGNDFYVAVDEPNDILEPALFQSNVSFDLARSFYEKLTLLMSIVSDFDVNN